MKKLFKKYPIISILFLLSGYLKIDCHWPDGDFRIPGMSGSTVVIGIIGIIVLYKIFNAAEALCRTKGLIDEPLRYRYDILLPIGVVAGMIQWRVFSPEKVEWMGAQVHRYDVLLGNQDFYLYHVAALAGLVILLRVLMLLREIAKTVERR